jgi:hypothetical protein
MKHFVKICTKHCVKTILSGRYAPGGEAPLAWHPGVPHRIILLNVLINDLTKELL